MTFFIARVAQADTYSALDGAPTVALKMNQII